MITSIELGDFLSHSNTKLEFEATIEIYPEFEIKDYSKYVFKKEEKKTKTVSLKLPNMT